jgi:predicted TIM-barrel fold metal-dependent hydrolase
MDENWESLTHEEFDAMHDVGVRSCRMNGFNGAGGTSLSNIQQQMLQFARSYPAQEYGWSLSAQLPLEMWASLKHFILHEPKICHITIIADHNGCATPADIGGTELDTFVQMLRSRRLHVKVSALYRRSPESIHHMQFIIHQFATSAPHSLLWGSDWPHVDSSNKSLHPPSTEIETDRADDVPAEMSALRSWLTDQQWNAMFKENPDRLFGQ